ncbi:hypothetical protein ARAM_000199 [Aspergillus rambellii]|uniref:Dimethylallyl tryptophan synthase n=1 Tax=Aspergillus rambellii TaxID=308745 RepID=A0A0F8WRT6_9EURO|nr:hypothetical protein ARAM_000199 [Aspergillus rambellii]
MKHHLNGNMNSDTNSGPDIELSGQLHGHVSGEVNGHVKRLLKGDIDGDMKSSLEHGTNKHSDKDSPQHFSYSSEPENGPKAWEIVSRWETSLGPSHEHWWRLTGPQLSTMLEEAGYPVHKQLEIVLFHYHRVVPYMGPKPELDGSFKWKSLVSSDGVPLEYSWKWDTPSKDPEIRFTIEAINEFSGTVADPLNQTPAIELLQGLEGRVPDLNQDWTSHFLSNFYDHDKAKYLREAEDGSGMPLRSTMLQGFASLAQYMPAIRQLGPSRALDILNDFLGTSKEGSYLRPFMLAVDNVEPPSSRLKLYFATVRTSFASMREIMTLGGRVSSDKIEQKLRTLHELVKAIMPVPLDLPDNADIPGPELPEYSADATASTSIDLATERPNFVVGYQYYFDIAPGAEFPDIKFYAPIRKDMMDDLTVANGLTRWMESQGRGAFCQNYMRVLRGLAGERSLSECHGIQTHICCMIKKDGQFDITSYLAPGVPGSSN